uniref:Uncharacterized protein n=1 Tax=Oryza rufipogon TaxID=4529 RepID=A0A0E0MVS1_ORYRU
MAILLQLEHTPATMSHTSTSATATRRANVTTKDLEAAAQRRKLQDLDGSIKNYQELKYEMH